MSNQLLQPLSNFRRIGGQPAVDCLVEAFYRRMDQLPQARGIRALHGSNLEPTKEVLKLYLAEWLGGPSLYSKQRGHPRLRMRHSHFAVGPADRDAWMLCMSGALEEVVVELAVRESLLRAFMKLADWIRNDPENPHDKR